MVSLHEAVAQGLAMSTELGLEKLPSLCPGGETISIARLLHYLPYKNDSHDSDCDDPITLNGGDSASNGEQVRKYFWFSILSDVRFRGQQNMSPYYFGIFVSFDQRLTSLV